MPSYETLPGRRQATYRVAWALLYLVLTLAGVIGLSWPHGYSLDGWAYALTHGSGWIIAIGAVVCAVTHLMHRWKIEMNVVPVVGLALTGYTAVLLFYVGPEREWLLFSCFILAAQLALAIRSLSIHDFGGEAIAWRRAATVVRGA